MEWIWCGVEDVFNRPAQQCGINGDHSRTWHHEVGVAQLQSKSKG